MYVGDFIDDISNFGQKLESLATKAKLVKGQVDQVVSGKKQVALVPSDGVYATVPISGQKFAVTIPPGALLAAGGIALWLLLRPRR